MSRKTILFIIIIFFLIGLGFFGYYFLFPKNQGEGTSKDPLSNNNQPENPFGSFFPTENINPENKVDEAELASQENHNLQNQIPKLRKISNVPVSGATIFERKATTTNEIFIDEEETKEDQEITEVVYRYIERATGHIFETTSHNLTNERISNTTIPKIYESFFLENKDQFVLRYLDENENIETYIATIKKTDSEENSSNKTFLDGVFLQKNIFDITPSPKGDNLFLLTNNPNQTSSSVTVGYITPSSKPKDQKLVFNSPISEWNAEWGSNDKIFLNTKASNFSNGFLYKLDINSEEFDKVVGPHKGMSSRISPDNKKIIFSTTNGKDIKTKIEDLEKRTLKNVKADTLAEKCIWNKTSTIIYCAVPQNYPEAIYPDYWYLGIVSFNDSIVKMDIENQTSEIIMSANSETSENLDIIDLQLSPKEDFLLFTNKIDLNLWSLDLK